jgi:predicted ATPase
MRKSCYESSDYPFSVEAVANMDHLEFTQPITMLCGGNGCGKTTLMEILACKTNAIRVNALFQENPKTDAIIRTEGAFRISMKRAARKNFYFSGEEFIKYIEWVESTKQEARKALKEIEDTYEKGSYAAKLASLPHLDTLESLNGMYASSLAKESHGEGFIDFFQNRLIKGGLYLLDEPEAALSYENQYALSIMIMDAVDDGCQFIISTHSPVIAGIPNAGIYHIIDGKIQSSSYEELDSIRFLKLFMQQRERMFSRII